MMDLAARLSESILLADGGTGTELIRLGAPTDLPGELLNLKRPDLVAEIHRSYAQAGSDLVVTNTFGANAVKLARHGYPDRVDQINEAAARLAREAVPKNVLVGGDIGPSGQMLKPYGPADPKELTSCYRQQAFALAEGGVDFLILETFFDLAEALLALRAALATGLPTICSMTFEIKRGSAFTMMGNPAAACATALAEAGAVAVGANCSVTIDRMPQIAKDLRQGTDLPLILQPNAGDPRLVDGRTVYGETAENFAAQVPALIAGGARIIGGCCGTDPRFIRATREVLDKLIAASPE